MLPAFDISWYRPLRRTLQLYRSVQQNEVKLYQLSGVSIYSKIHCSKFLNLLVQLSRQQKQE